MFQIGDIVKPIRCSRIFPHPHYEGARYKVVGNNLIDIIECPWMQGACGNKNVPVSNSWWECVELAPEFYSDTIDDFI